MQHWSFWFSLALVVFAAIHALTAWLVVRWRLIPRTWPASSQPPARAAVILSVRGSDPSLELTLRQLLDQDYANYELHFVIDHADDPAGRVVARVLEEWDVAGRTTRHQLRSAPETCGLKCAALVQAIETLRDVELVATIDADVNPPRCWLSQLVAPLVDPQIGAVSGNHWFEPTGWSTGSIIRSLWNAGALIPTAAFANPWAGSLAMRLADIRQSGLIDDWKRTIVDDGPVRAACGRIGKSIVFQPQLILLNRELCSLRFALTYMIRMLTWSRVYDRSFVFTAAHAVVNGSVFAAVVGGLLINAAQYHWTGVLICLMGLALHGGLLWLAYGIVRQAVGRVIRPRGESLPAMPLAVAVRSLLLTPLTFVIYLYSVVRAICVRTICWRQIRYRIEGPGRVRRLDYQPFRETDVASNTPGSI